MVRGRGGGSRWGQWSNQICTVTIFGSRKPRKPRGKTAEAESNAAKQSLYFSTSPQLNYSIVAAVYLLLSSNSSSLFLAL